ncbi:hypothetical protein Drorol1_Dr00008371 [Drosera rotundifolia]
MNEIRDEKTVRSRKSQPMAPDAKVFRSGLDQNGGENIATEGNGAVVVSGRRRGRRREGEEKERRRVRKIGLVAVC